MDRLTLPNVATRSLDDRWLYPALLLACSATGSVDPGIALAGVAPLIGLAAPMFWARPTRLET